MKKIMIAMVIALTVNLSKNNIKDLIGTIKLTREELWEAMSKEDPRLLQILQEESPTLERWHLIQPEFINGQMYVTIHNLPLLIQLLYTLAENQN